MIFLSLLKVIYWQKGDKIVARNQRVTTSTPSGFLTAGSDKELVGQVARDVKSTIRKIRRTGYFSFLSPDQKKDKSGI